MVLARLATERRIGGPRVDEIGEFALWHGDCRDMLTRYPDSFFHGGVSDPPYNLGFMGRSWDKVGSPAFFQRWCTAWGKELLRTLRPGAYMAVFGGRETYHRMACGLEDAGFRVADCLIWLNGEGFPKGADVGKAIDAQAGAKRTVIGKGINHDAKVKHGGTWTGGVYAQDDYTGASGPWITAPATELAKIWDGWRSELKPGWEPIALLQKPIPAGYSIADNVKRWGVGALNIEACRIPVASGDDQSRERVGGFNDSPILGSGAGKVTQKADAGRFPTNVLLDETAAAQLDAMTGGASRFFYQAKAKDRDRGEGNNHPTVKPIRLIRYLHRLIIPPGGLTVDPFAGSGRHIIAALLEGSIPVGIEKDEHNHAIMVRHVPDYREYAGWSEPLG